MKNKKKICVVTGTRAEFGLLQWLMHEIKEDPDLELQIIATGMHLSPEFGLTFKEIERAGFPINKKVELLLSSDTPIGVSKSMGLGMISMAEAFDDLSPDLIVVLGDRFEIFAAVAAAVIARIPIGHIHGGETSQGAIDEPIRHSITKMSHLHFTATEVYRQRVIQLGEHPERVFNVGAPGLDNIDRLVLLDRSSFATAINFELKNKNLLVTFHPVTLEKNTSKQQFEELLKALDVLENTGIIFTKPNADTDGRIINILIDDYVTRYPEKACAFTSLGQLRYLSALQHVDAVVGNSSSGLIEAPSFKVATINIGDRQKGRIKGDSIIDCEPEENAILQALSQALSKSFQDILLTVSNPYGSGGGSHRIKEIIKHSNLEGIIKKTFFDINIPYS